MRYNKYYVVVLSILILFVFISSVSAADVNGTDILPTIDNTEILSTTIDDNEILTTGNDVSNYSELSKEIAVGGQIELQHDYYKYDSGNTINIPNDSSIEGKGAVIDMAGSSIRAFIINGSNVIINNLTIKNVNSEDEGGAIYSETGGIVTNCNFINNSAGFTGGAISFKNVTGSVANCNFIENSAAQGSAVCFWDVAGNVTNCTFTDNSAASAAALYLCGGIVSGCTFTGNSNDLGRGGAIASFTNVANIVNCTFTDNYGAQGGAIAFYDADCNVTGCTFIGNAAIIGTDGGAIWTGGGNVTNCTFVNNTSEDAGGAISFYDYCIVTDCTFLNNDASGYGGAISLNDGIVTNCNFINNSGEIWGGAIASGHVSVNNCTFTGNTISGDVKNMGGHAIYSNIGGSVTNCVFVDNSAESIKYTIYSAGALYDSLDNNWWGSNDPDWDELISYDQIPSCYAVLDVTAEPDEIRAGGKSDIITKFIWSGTDTDATNLLPKRYILLSSDGNLTQTEGDVGLISAFYANDEDKYAVNAEVDNEELEVKVKVNGLASPTNITVNVTSLNLTVGESGSINATLNPADAGNLTYTSSNSNIAVVENGKIKAVATGTAVVTVSFPGSGDYSAAENKTIEVTVTLKDASVSAEDMNLFVGDNATVNYSTNPANLNVTFVIDDSGVYTVNENGFVTALKNGTGSILVKVGGDGVFAENSTTVTVTVSKVPTEISAEGCELYVDDNATISYKLIPEDAEGDVRFMSNDSSVVYADAETGIVVGRGEGTATVSVTYFGNDKYGSSTTNVTVTVTKVPTEISAEGCELFVDDNATISYELIPEDAEGDVRFMSNDSSVVYADAETGIVVGRGEGTATVSISFFGDDKYESSTTNVTVTVTKIPTEISAEGCELFVDDNATISYELIPEDAEGDVRFMSNDSSVVYADAETGVVVGRGVGTATVSVTYFGNDKYASSSTKVTVTVRKIPTVITAEGCELFVDDNATISYELIPEDAEGDVRFMSNDTGVVYADAETGVVVGRGEGTATVSISFFGDDKYESSTTNVTVTVTKIPTEISAEGCELFVDDNATISYVLIPEDAEGDVRFMSNDTGVVYADAETGVVVGRSAGTATVSISFFGDDKYESSTTNVTVTVNRIPTEISAEGCELFVDDNATISYELIPEDAEGDVRFMSNDSSVVYADAETGVVVGRGVGTATVSVTYFGNDKYASSSTNVTVTVNRIPTEISAEGCELFVDDNATISYVLIPEDAEGDVRFMSNDSSVVYADAETGVVVGRGEGTATVSVTYFGDDKYASSSTNVTVTVNRIPTEISAEGCELYGDDNATISYKLIPEDAEGDVRFMSNDTSIVYADAETGVVVARGAGTATVSVSYFGNDKYAPSNTTVKVVVNKLNTTLVTKYENGTIYATVTDTHGNPVSGIKVGFAVNGVKYVISDENGQANYTIGDWGPGYYSVKVMAYGNDLYETSNQETVVVTKEQSKIYLRNALYFVTDTKIVKVTLWDGKNKPIAGKTVHIKVYDSLYSGVTDKNGNAYIRVGIGFGVHDVTVIFDGDYQYAASNRTGQIKVIRETPSIMVRGADQKFKVSDNPKTVKVYLWDRNSKPLPVGSKVAIKINGQTYVGLTDSNGIASININVNTVGVYDAELKYAGNSAYNAVTRKIQITIS